MSVVTMMDLKIEQLFGLWFAAFGRAVLCGLCQEKKSEVATYPVHAKFCIVCTALYHVLCAYIIERQFGLTALWIVQIRQ